jgi:23S rRNA (uracil1939-C5)-methyltransferase
MNPPGEAGVRIEAMAHGGAGVGRRNGKAVFVPGAVPGDLAEVEVIEDRGRFERARLVRVLERSPDRVEVPCPWFGMCGGCQWQMAAYPAQLAWKRETVASQLAHLGGLEAEVAPTVAPGPPFGYRNRIDLRVTGGRPALSAARSHDLVALDRCLLLIPPLAGVFGRLGDLTGVSRLTLRAGVRTGERVAIVDGRVPPHASGWGVAALPARRAVIHEAVAGATLRVSGRSFFQVNTDGAEALVGLVGDALAGAGSGTLVDGYAGGGLFAATVGARFDRVVAVEADPGAVSDLRANVPAAEVVASPMERGVATVAGTVDAVVVDPPRAGMGAAVVEAICRLRPPVVVVVSCDPAAFARDARLLSDRGYRLERVRPLDLFPQTFHVEIVARFTAGRS